MCKKKEEKARRERENPFERIKMMREK